MYWVQKSFRSWKHWAQKFCNLDHKYSDLILVDLNRTNSILNRNHKYSDLIHIDPNKTDSNQPITDDSTNIVLIYDSSYIHTIETIITSPVHSLVLSSPIFSYGRASHPPSPLNDSLAKRVIHIEHPKPRDNTLNPLPKVPVEPDSDSISSDYFLLS